MEPRALGVASVASSPQVAMPLQSSIIRKGDIVVLNDVAQAAIEKLVIRSSEIEQPLRRLLQSNQEHCEFIPQINDKIRIVQSELEDLGKQKTSKREEAEKQEKHLKTASEASSLLGKVVPVITLFVTSSPYVKTITVVVNLVGALGEALSGYLSSKTQVAQECIKIVEQPGKKKPKIEILNDANEPLLQAMQQKLEQLSDKLAKEKQGARGWFALLSSNKEPEWKTREEEIEAGKSFIKVYKKNKKTFDRLIIEKVDSTEMACELTDRIDAVKAVAEQNSAWNIMKGLPGHFASLADKLISYLPLQKEKNN